LPKKEGDRQRGFFDVPILGRSILKEKDVHKPLNGKVAFINGGSRGIGAAIARRLARDGASVAFSYQSSVTAAESLAGEIRDAGGAAFPIQADSSDPRALTHAIDSVAERFGRLDILVNSAGVFLTGPLETFPIADFDKTIDVNVRAVFVAVKAAAAHMREGGRIINISSANAGRMPFAGGAVYAMSKSALSGLVRGLARDLGGRGITVNNVLPGPTDTDLNPAGSDFAASLHGLMALPRHGTPGEIASMVAYLASAEAAFVTGADLSVDGGFAA
jgi:3-oxoacyl-[acyl-carrier protein] reductase